MKGSARLREGGKGGEKLKSAIYAAVSTSETVLAERLLMSNELYYQLDSVKAIIKIRLEHN